MCIVHYYDKDHNYIGNNFENQQVYKAYVVKVGWKRYYGSNGEQIKLTDDIFEAEFFEDKEEAENIAEICGGNIFYVTLKVC